MAASSVTYALLLTFAVQEVESLRVRGSRVEKLQAELSSQKERFEEVDLLRSKLKEMKLRHEQTLEGKAKIEDEVEMLRSKVTLFEDIQADHAQLKAQCDALASVSVCILHWLCESKFEWNNNC